MANGKYRKWLTKDGLTLLRGWARNGLTDEQIAEKAGISRSTLSAWKLEFPDISDALKKGKEVIDIEVENALLKRALGFSYVETTRERIVDSGQKQRHGGESELTEKDWDFAVKYFGGKCCYCGQYGSMTKDHIKPLADGGKLTRDNIVPCCQSCNSSKKDAEMMSWFQKQPFYDKSRMERICDYVAFVAQLSNENEPGELVITKEVTKMVIPDTTAQIFWLKNRRPEWRERPTAELTKYDTDPLTKSIYEVTKNGLIPEAASDPDVPADEAHGADL